MAVEAVRELLADEVAEQHRRVGCGTSARISAMPSDSPMRSRSMTPPAPAVEDRRVAFDELHRRHHLAVPRRLEEPHVRGVGVDDVHVVEIDALARKPPAQLPGDHQIARHGGRRAVAAGRTRCRGAGYRFAFMIRFGGSPYASQTPQIVVTAVQTMTA